MRDLMRQLEQDFAREFRAIPKPDGLEVTDCSGIIKGNADLELTDMERIEGICALSKEIRYE